VKLGSLDQARFPTLPADGRWRSFIATYLAGRVFSVDADSGAILWSRDLALDWSTQSGAPVAGMFRQYGGARDLVFVGTRKASAMNRLLALEPFTGADVGAFDLTGTVSSIYYAPIVDYATRRVFFTAHETSPTGPNLYCIEVSPSGAPFAASSLVWKVTVPTATDGPPATVREPLTTSPVLRSGRIYVGDAKGAVYSVRASDGGDLRRFDTGSAASVLGFLFPDRSGDALYFTSGNRTFKVVDSDSTGLVATPEPGWPVSIAPTATMPLFYRRQSLPGFAWAATGGAGGTRVFRIESGAAVEVADLAVSDTPGQPTLDSAFGVMYLGTTAGSLFAVPVTLP
jgi:outer membrane protein assembly factor BamB